MEAGSTFRFAQVARTLAEAARAEGVDPPAFRSPPRGDGVTRAIRRCPNGVVVAVQTRDRPFEGVVADMVEGVVATARREGAAAHRLRARLWSALADDAEGAGGADLVEARVAERQTQAAETRRGVGGADLVEARVAERQTQAA